MKIIKITIFVLFSIGLLAKPDRVINLFPDGKIPDFIPGKEDFKERKGDDIKYTCIPVGRLEFYLPEKKLDKTTGFVIVCPGGAYKGLSATKEGKDLAKVFNSVGIPAAVLIYRVPSEKGITAFQDGQRAIRIVRSMATELNINPNKIAVMGFSAGGNLAIKLSNSYDDQSYPKVDEIDNLSPNPNLTIPIYPAYTANPQYQKMFEKKQVSDSSYCEKYGLAENIKVSKNTPPAFILQAQDDEKCVNSSIAYYLALKDIGVDAELHLYSKGGHGFGLAKDKNIPVSSWISSLLDWLKFHNFN